MSRYIESLEAQGWKLIFTSPVDGLFTVELSRVLDRLLGPRYYHYQGIARKDGKATSVNFFFIQDS